MAYLTAKPQRQGKRHADTLNGCRRFWRFMNAVQLEFGVCFNNQEWDRGYSLSEFIELIQAKLENPLEGKCLADKRLREARIERKDRTFIWSLIVAVLLAIPAAFWGIVAKSIVGVVWAGAAAGIYIYQSRQVAYAQRLIESIEAAIG